MIYINHRINTVEQLKSVPKTNGVEIDVRYHNNELILHHDPFNHHLSEIQSFQSFLEKWNHLGPMILNIKTEGIERKCVDMMNQYKIKSWFFLDLSMPVFAKFSNNMFSKNTPGFKSENLAVRYSEFEPIEYALSFANKVQWLWLDCFTHLPLNEKIAQQIVDAGFKICLVSPELQKHPLSKIEEFKKQCKNINIHAICTKRPDLWGQA